VAVRPGPLARVRSAVRAGPLAQRAFLMLSAGQVTSTIGDYCYAVALPWLVLSRHGGALLLGTVLACYGVARTATIPLGGILADKIGARVLMLAARAVLRGSEQGRALGLGVRPRWGGCVLLDGRDHGGSL
jgi:MFS family permease